MDPGLKFVNAVHHSSPRLSTVRTAVNLSILGLLRLKKLIGLTLITSTMPNKADAEMVREFGEGPLLCVLDDRMPGPVGQVYVIEAALIDEIERQPELVRRAFVCDLESAK